MSTARLYVRVSTEKQVREGESLDVQLVLLRARATAAGFDDFVEYVERGVSGSVALADRPAGGRMLADLEAGDALFITKLDRLGRTTSDVTATADALVKAGVGINSADINGDISKDPTARLLFDIMASFASHERARIRERIAEAMAHLKSQGDRFVSGSTPFGYVKVLDQHGKGKHGVAPIAAVHDEARKLKAQGYSARAAAGHLTGLGHKCTHKAVLTLWQTMNV